MRTLIIVLSLLLCGIAQAATTWTTPSTRVSLCTDTTGTATAPSASTDGLSLVGLATVQVCVEPAVGSSLTAGSLYAYLWNPSSSGPDGGFSGFWGRAPDLDLTVAASTAAGYGSCFLGINVKGNGARIAYIPYGLGAITTKTWILGFR